MNAIEAVVSRLCSHLKSGVGHIVWTDRGYSKVAASKVLQDLGLQSCGVMAANRIGLPRRFLVCRLD